MSKYRFLSFDKTFLKVLNFIRSLFGQKVRNTAICYTGETEQIINDSKLLNYKSLTRNF